MHDFDDDTDFDALLRTALFERPEPVAADGLAARVLAAAPRRVPAWPVWAAAAAIAVVVLAGGLRLLALGTSDPTAADAATAVSNDSVALLPVGGFVFVAALAWTIARPVFYPTETPAMASVS